MFTPGDLVFAQVRGWWPWPARLMCQVSPSQFKVFFYGTRQESWVQEDCMWPFQDKLDSFARKYGRHQDYQLALREMKTNPDIFAVNDDDLCGHKCMTCDIKRKSQQLKVCSNSLSNEAQGVNGSAEKFTKNINQVKKMSSVKRGSEVWLVPKISGGIVNSEEIIKTGMKTIKVNISNKSTDADLEMLNIKSSKIKIDEGLKFGWEHEESSDNAKAASKHKLPQMAKRSRHNPQVNRNQKETMKRKMKMLSKMVEKRKLDGTHNILTKIGYPVKENPPEVKAKPDGCRITDKVQINKKKLDMIVNSECNATQNFNESECMESESSKKMEKTCSLKQFGTDRNEASEDRIFKQVEYPGRELKKPKIEGCDEEGTVIKSKSKIGLVLSFKKNSATSRLDDVYKKDISNSSKKADKTDYSKNGVDNETQFEQDTRSSPKKSDMTVHSKLDRKVEKDGRSTTKKYDKIDNSQIDQEDGHLFKKDIINSELSKRDSKDGNLFKMDTRSSPRKYDKTNDSKSGLVDDNSFGKVKGSSLKIDYSETDREVKLEKLSEFESSMEEEEDALEVDVSYGLLDTSKESEAEDEEVSVENILERDLAITDDSSKEEDTEAIVFHLNS